ncbi:hypothetical protein ACH4TV_32745 [Streptomyces sp. NPDC020898]|uniref:hypothetical protein n=1 Tax=Streptomyces sp. NPDC020898 TaxID=3365101 RepID=UPI00379F6FF4
MCDLATKLQAAYPCRGGSANNADFVHYSRALAAGWAIAGGIIEGAARHLVADRLDITGSRWSVPGSEALLNLRAVIDNDDFPAYSHSKAASSTRRPGTGGMGCRCRSGMPWQPEGGCRRSPGR